MFIACTVNILYITSLRLEEQSENSVRGEIVNSVGFVSLFGLCYIFFFVIFSAFKNSKLFLGDRTKITCWLLFADSSSRHSTKQ